MSQERALSTQEQEPREPHGFEKEKEIAVLAYNHWLARGCPDGSPEEDWFLAEREVLQDSSHMVVPEEEPVCQ